jgi:hypothetical protein
VLSPGEGQQLPQGLPGVFIRAEAENIPRLGRIRTVPLRALDTQAGEQELSGRAGLEESWLVRFGTKARHVVQGYLWASIPPV